MMPSEVKCAILCEGDWKIIIFTVEAFIKWLYESYEGKQKQVIL